jgi:hypothetical protein
MTSPALGAGSYFWVSRRGQIADENGSIRHKPLSEIGESDMFGARLDKKPTVLPAATGPLDPSAAGSAVRWPSGHAARTFRILAGNTQNVEWCRPNTGSGQRRRGGWLSWSRAVGQAGPGADPGVWSGAGPTRPSPTCYPGGSVGVHPGHRVSGRLLARSDRMQPVIWT